MKIGQLEIVFASIWRIGDMNYRATSIGDLECWEEDTSEAISPKKISGDHGQHIGDMTLSDFGDIVIS